MVSEQQRSLVVIVSGSWLACHGFKTSATEDPPCREVMHVTSVESSNASATRRLLATDHVILNLGQVTWTTPELAPPLLAITPHQREDV
ncbi:hypothetical protein TNCV_3389011 [Trichonephila clavipes]|nr:hypothetical protein TNCV_3389011 [Trichonephila clavipes]